MDDTSQTFGIQEDVFYAVLDASIEHFPSLAGTNHLMAATRDAITAYQESHNEEIARLRQENERLKGALEKILNIKLDEDAYADTEHAFYAIETEARAALKGGK